MWNHHYNEGKKKNPWPLKVAQCPFSFVYFCALSVCVVRTQNEIYLLNNCFKYSVGNESAPLHATEEGNGFPLQCSCLENPMDRGAYWAPWDFRVGHDQSDLACTDKTLITIGRMLYSEYLELTHLYNWHFTPMEQSLPISPCLCCC